MKAKKDERHEKKKRKLEALANVTKLNEMDREQKQQKKSSASESEQKDSEPSNKRPKVEYSEAADSNAPQQESRASSVLSDEDYKQLKRELNQKKRELKNVPKLRMRLFGDNASLAVSPSIRTPIFLTDIQHLIMYALFGSASPCIPTRWCHLEKVNKIPHTVVCVVDGLSLYHFSSYESHFESCAKIFEHKLEVVMPRKSSDELLNEMITVPITEIHRKDLIEEHGSLEAAIDLTKDPVLMVTTIFPVSDSDNDTNENVNGASSADDELFPRTKLLLSALQMVDEGYPLPLRGELANRYKDFVMTKDSYVEVSARSPMFGVDCEMCRTSAGVNELTRISIVNEKHESIYETLVCPKNKIIDYLTPYSGITPEIMKNVTKSLAEVQEDVRRLLPADAILVGQSLQSDLMAMRMMHPYVIDTSVIFNISGDRRRKSKLQTLASEFLGESIQKNRLGHDSIEDCTTSLKLTKLKLRKGIDFGDAILTNRREVIEKQKTLEANGTIDKSKSQPTESTSTTTNKMDRNTAVVTSDRENTEAYQAIIDSKIKDENKKATNSIRIYPNTSIKSAVQKTCEVALSHALTLTHLIVPEKSFGEDKIEKSLKKIDEQIATIWDSVAPNGLFVVVLSGRNATDNSASGVAMLQNKKL